jgi:hypothetical protein
MSTSEIAAPPAGSGSVEAAEVSIPGPIPAHADTSTKLPARWLLPARILWVLIALYSVVTFIFAISATYDRLNNLTFIADQSGRNAAAQALAQLGLSTGGFAAISVGVVIFRTLVYFAAAIIIFARKSNDLMAYFVSIFLLTFSVGRMVQVMSAETTWGWPAAIFIAISYSAFVIFFYIFPDGRFVPAWTRLLAGAWLVIIVLAFVFPSSAVDIRNYLPYGITFVVTAVLALGAFAQIYRYRHAAGPTEKQQIKWIAYGATIILAINLLFTTINILYSGIEMANSPTAQAAMYQLLMDTAVSVQLLIIPIALGISILRYRLWDIDIIINRTLVYVPLTGIVAGLYSAMVALFQKLFQTFTGSQSDIAIILTTLLLAALFTPLKNALQALVDKRFKDPSDPVKSIKALGKQVAQSIYALDARAVTQRFFEEATTSFDAGGALYMEHGHNGAPIKYATQGWHDSQAQIMVPVQAGERQVGKLLLGRRAQDRTYREKDTQALQEVAGQIAAALDQLL